MGMAMSNYTKIINFLRANAGAFRAIEIGSKLNLTAKEVREALKMSPDVEMSGYNSTDRYSIKRQIPQDRAPISRLKGEWKPGLAMNIAMDRCRESRSGEFHAVVISGGEGKFNIFQS